jgi:hypothetical protein
MYRRGIDVDGIEHQPFPDDNDDEHDPGHDILGAANDAWPDDKHNPA